MTNTLISLILAGTLSLPIFSSKPAGSHFFKVIDEPGRAFEADTTIKKLPMDFSIDLPNQKSGKVPPFVTVRYTFGPAEDAPTVRNLRDFYEDCHRIETSEQKNPLEYSMSKSAHCELSQGGRFEMSVRVDAVSYTGVKGDDGKEIRIENITQRASNGSKTDLSILVLPVPVVIAENDTERSFEFAWGHIDIRNLASGGDIAVQKELKSGTAFRSYKGFRFDSIPNPQS